MPLCLHEERVTEQLLAGHLCEDWGIDLYCEAHCAGLLDGSYFKFFQQLVVGLWEGRADVGESPDEGVGEGDERGEGDG